MAVSMKPGLRLVTVSGASSRAWINVSAERPAFESP